MEDLSKQSTSWESGSKMADKFNTPTENPLKVRFEAMYAVFENYLFFINYCAFYCDVKQNAFSE